MGVTSYHQLLQQLVVVAAILGRWRHAEAFFLDHGSARRYGHLPRSSYSGSHRQLPYRTRGSNVDDPTLLHTATTLSATMKETYDVVVVGSGIGGLCCASILAKYGYSVCVLESHTHPGGAAHGFQVALSKDKVFEFDTGPSFFSGINPNLPAKSSNPMRTVLDTIGEQVECAPYTSFGLIFPEGNFVHTTSFGLSGKGEFSVLEKLEGHEAVKQWEQLMEAMKPLEAAVDAIPTAALRFDPGVALTMAPFLLDFLTKTNPLENLKLTTPFSTILRQVGIAEEGKSFVRNWIDLLCFCLSGLPADGTITAEMALMMGEFYDANAVMDCPRQGAKSIVDALVRGLQKYGGDLFCNSHVQQINLDRSKNRATGVILRNGKQVAATKAVVSNLSVWDLFQRNILDPAASALLSPSFLQERRATPVGKSFMHLHVGFRISPSELEQLQAHYMYIDDWSRGVTAEDNAVLVSIPSVHDPSLAPEGYAVLHAYTPATETYDRWAGMDRKSEQYKKLKEERSQYLWKVLEKVLPDIRKRTEVVRVGTPLTHERFLRRWKGSYGPAIHADSGSFPFPTTPIGGLILCGDSCFPGIGVPAVAGSGLLAAHSISFDSVGKQLELVKRLKSL